MIYTKYLIERSKTIHTHITLEIINQKGLYLKLTYIHIQLLCDDFQQYLRHRHHHHRHYYLLSSSYTYHQTRVIVAIILEPIKH